MFLIFFICIIYIYILIDSLLCYCLSDACLLNCGTHVSSSFGRKLFVLVVNRHNGPDSQCLNSRWHNHNNTLSKRSFAMSTVFSSMNPEQIAFSVHIFFRDIIAILLQASPILYCILQHWANVKYSKSRCSPHSSNRRHRTRAAFRTESSSGTCALLWPEQGPMQFAF